MNELRDYLRNEHKEYQRESDETKNLIHQLHNTLIKTCDQGEWSYSSDQKPDPNHKNYSFSTNSMIVWSLCNSIISTKEINDTIKRSTQLLAQKIKANQNDIITKSNTYGDNDPFTTYWLLKILNCNATPIHSNFTNLRKNILAAAKKHARSFVKKWFQDAHKDQSSDQNIKVQNAFTLLKCLQVTKSIYKEESSEIVKIRDQYSAHFERLLHEHLSYKMIPDSRFDPAELIFSLEGLLLLDKTTVLNSLITRVFQVISESQTENPYWRPQKPFMCTKNGFTLYPLSVEVANSLLRICQIVDDDCEENTYFAKSLHLFQRYIKWLNAKKETVSLQKKEQYIPVVGWPSEYIASIGVIHTWQTSQVLIFLNNYAGCLKGHMAAKALLISGLTQEKKPKLTEKWEESESLNGLRDNSGNNPYLVRKRIKEYYIDSRKNGSGDKHYSMILYGPPGTGKTTLAEELAAELHYSLITVTPNDFLAGGAAEIEARAKMIFDVLGEQNNAVILFDEIDNFILDRESKRYREQVGIFQFMTPGMLTKLNDLRKKESSIFIIATNYEERIDGAAKRIGRIDDRFLLSLPGKEQRKTISKILCEKYDIILSSAHDEIALKTPLYSFKEIEQVIIEIKKQNYSDAEVTQKIDGIIKMIKPTVTLDSYKNRFADDKHSKNYEGQEPFEEFFLLLYLKIQTLSHEIEKNKQVIEKVIKRLLQKENGINNLVVKLGEYIQCDQIINKIKKDYTIRNIINGMNNAL